MKTYKYCLISLLLLLLNFQCSAADKDVKITNAVKENALTELMLSPESERKLAIVTAKAEQRTLKKTRLLTGEIILPALSNAQPLQTNTPTSAELLKIAQLQLEADGQIEQAKVQLSAAKQILARNQQTLENKVGTQRAVDEAKVQVRAMQAALQTAQQRREVLGTSVTKTQSSNLWLRVPVYVGDLEKLQANASIQVVSLANRNHEAGLTAKPLSVQSVANATTATVDWFYLLKDTQHRFRAGQRVGVLLPLQESSNSLVVPWSAIVYDINGGSWLYEKIAPQQYRRQRVQVLQIVDDWAAITGNIKTNTEVVIIGVAELFGSEFGAGK